MALVPSKINILQKKLTDLRRLEEEKRTKDLAAELNLSYLDLSITPIETESLSLLEETKARKAKAAVIQKKGKEIYLAIGNPDNVLFQEILTELKKSGYRVKIFLASLRSLEKAWAGYKELTPALKEITGRIKISKTVLEKLRKEIKNLEDIKKQIDCLPASQATDIIEALLAGALKTNASDIHLETKESQVNVRYRLDGVLEEAVFLSLKTYQLALNRIKLLAGLKLNIHDISQDGRFTISLNGQDIEVRVSCLPSAYGENIVMRVLNPSMISLCLKDLGFQPEHLKIIQKEIKKTNGLIIATGPTGSGKTTTLYACLKTANQPGIKIVTLEDPIEYHLEGITQTQVETEKGYTFANGLRAILRQDPDVMLVGEIRDQETAETALQASLTGHLVFSTLHTNDAAGALPRLIELGAKAPILASGLNLIMAQRLARKLCLKCRQAINPSAEQIKEIKKVLVGLKIEIKKIYRANGCSQCSQTGYQGRIGIFEMISIDEEAEKLIGSSPSHTQVSAFMRKKGILFMKQDVLLKALEGITSLEEVERVVGE